MDIIFMMIFAGENDFLITNTRSDFFIFDDEFTSVLLMLIKIF